MVNTAQLETKMRENGLNHNYLSDCLDLSLRKFENKLNNKEEFQVSEVYFLCEKLNIAMPDRGIIFGI